MDFLPEKIDVKRSLQTQSDRKFHELSEYVIISQKLWCFNDNIIKIPIPIFAFLEYIKGEIGYFTPISDGVIMKKEKKPTNIVCCY